MQLSAIILIIMSLVMMGLLAAPFIISPTFDLEIADLSRPIGQFLIDTRIDIALDYLTYGLFGIVVILPIFIRKKMVLFTSLAMLFICGGVVEYGFKQLWERPRPYEVAAGEEFSPITQINGSILPYTIYSGEKNSFVSRHVSIATMLLMITIIWGSFRKTAFLFLLVTIVARVSTWQHFLSDCLLAMPITLLFVGFSLIFWQLLLPSEKNESLMQSD